MKNHLKAAAINANTGGLASDFFTVTLLELDLTYMKMEANITVFEHFGHSEDVFAKGARIKQIIIKGSERELIYDINEKHVFNNDTLVFTRVTKFNISSWAPSYTRLMNIE